MLTINLRLLKTAHSFSDVLRPLGLLRIFLPHLQDTLPIQQPTKLRTRFVHSFSVFDKRTSKACLEGLLSKELQFLPLSKGF